MNNLVHIRDKNVLKLNFIVFDRLAIAICTHEFEFRFWYGFAH